MRSVFKYLSFLFSGLFLWAAFVQLNDPDAGMWIGIYLVAAIGALLNGLGRLPKGVNLVLAIAFGVLAVAFWPNAFEGVTIGEGDIDNIERGRESLGMAITALLFLLLGVFSQKKAAS